MMPFYSIVISFVGWFFGVLLPLSPRFAFLKVEGFVLFSADSSKIHNRLGVSKPPLCSTPSPFDEDQYVYIPQSDLDDAIQKEKKRHDKERDKLQSVIDQQRQELQRLKEKDRKEYLKQKMYQDACWAENLPMLWSENHTEKTTRLHGRLEYLTNENVRLQNKLEEENARHSQEIEQLVHQLKQEKEKTQEAKDVLGLERSYYETSVRLLEAGLEREGRKVKSLQTKLKAQKQRMERCQGHSIDQPLPQRSHHEYQSFEQQQIPGQYQQQNFEEQRNRQEQTQYRVYRPHENQYFEQFQQHQEQGQEQQTEQPYQHSQQPQEPQHHQPQQYHSDQFAFENAHYFNLHDQRQQQQQRQTRRYQSVVAERDYSDGRSYSTVSEQEFERISHNRRQRTHGRIVIPTMNGPHLGGGGINDIRNRLY